MVESKQCSTQNWSRRIWAALLAALLALSTLTLAGCSSGSEASSASSSSSSAAVSSSSSAEVVAAEIQASVSIVFPEDENLEAVNETLTLPEGSTVLDALEQVDPSIVVTDSEYGPFVEEIGGVANGSHGSSSGWVYTVNGEFASDSAGEHALAEGDVVEWTFYM